MKKDETALAIARLVEDAKTAKVEKPGRLIPATLAQNRGLARSDLVQRREGGAAPSTSTKRPKTFGS